ncbi:MAG: DUF4296 domain-containing protein [Flavobacteriaceae bacterium]
MKKFLCVFIVISFFSCTSNTIYEKPKDLIPKDTMKALMTDLFIATSSTNLKNIHFQKGINYTSLVYNKYKIDSTRLKRSNYYYTTRVDEYQKLLEDVKLALENQKKIYVKQRHIKDSIRKDSIKKLAPKVKKDPNTSYKNLSIPKNLLHKKRNASKSKKN